MAVELLLPGIGWWERYDSNADENANEPRGRAESERRRSVWRSLVSCGGALGDFGTESEVFARAVSRDWIFSRSSARESCSAPVSTLFCIARKK